MSTQAYKLYEIEWMDAASEDGWEDINEIHNWSHQDYLINEIGWMICENKKYIVISSQIAADGDVGNRTKIPVGWIVSKRRIITRRSNGKRKPRKT